MKKLVKDSRWYEQINRELEYNNKFVEDIKFVSNDNGWCTWQEFINMKIVKKWESDDDWVIVGNSWFISFDDCDGYLFWKLHQMPEKPPKKLNIKLKIYN